MILYEDTRQKEAKHDNVHRYCKDNNIDIVPICLEVGDYMLPNGNISVDTKASIVELAGDLYSDKLAFNKKYKKGLKAKIRLVVLIEEPIKTMSELVRWKNPHGKINGRLLIELMNTVQLSYGVKFMFCDKSETGQTIIKILKGEENGK